MIATAAAASGCGGGSTTTAKATDVLSLGPVLRCLRDIRHARVTTSQADLDQIARRAGRGAARVRLGVGPKVPKGLNVATVVLERSAHDARSTEAHYRSVYRALGGNPAGVLVRSANAVVAFGARPSAQDRSVVMRCVQP